MANPTNLLDSSDWMTQCPPVLDHPKRGIRLLLFEDDIRSAQLSYESYQVARQESIGGRSSNRGISPRLFHYAKSFVCSMRRAGRMLEALNASRVEFPKPVGDAIKLAWRKKRTMLNRYIKPRNAIEHIDHELSNNTNPSSMNLHYDVFAVTYEPGNQVKITETDIVSVLEARNEIVGAILKHMRPGKAS
jgi:hypothetical protein